MKLLVVLALCVALVAADRRRSDRDGGDAAARPGQRQHRHGHDDDDDDRHSHERTFSHLADLDRGPVWKHSHESGRRARPEAEHAGHGWSERDSHQDDRRGHRGDRNQEHRRPDGDRHHEHRRPDDERHQEHRRPDGDRHQEHRRPDGDRHQEHRRPDGDRHQEHHRPDDDRHQEHSERHRNVDNTPKKPSHGKPGRKEHRGDDRRPGAADAGGVRLSAAGEQTQPEEHAPEWETAAQAPAALGADQTPEQQEEDWTISPPPHENVAEMARYIVHVSNWTAMATISSREPTRGMPFANVFSVSDGTRYHSSGVPYLYLTGMEISVKDLRVNNNASLTMSLAQTDFCERHSYDPEDPLCAHVILTGAVLQVDQSDPEYTFAHDALFTRHPEMASWPVGHHWFVAKLEIQNILVLDFFGGAKTVTPEEYFATSPFKVHPRRSNQV